MGFLFILQLIIQCNIVLHYIGTKLKSYNLRLKLRHTVGGILATTLVPQLCIPLALYISFKIRGTISPSCTPPLQASVPPTSRHPCSMLWLNLPERYLSASVDQTTPSDCTLTSKQCRRTTAENRSHLNHRPRTIH